MMIFYVKDNKIDAAKVNEYMNERYPNIDFNELNMSTAFTNQRILKSQIEKNDFLIALGYSKEGLAYYVDNDLESELDYEAFTILSRSDLINYLKNEEC